MYLLSRGIQQNYDRAFYWYKKAADQGTAVAQYTIGTMHEKGQGVVRSQIEAVQWYRKASAQQYESATERLHQLGKNRE